MSRPAPHAPLALLLLAWALGPGGCAPSPVEEVVEEAAPVAAGRAALTVGGCTCPTSGNCAALSFSDIPANNAYYITTFGGGSDTQGMACGGTADGTWAYVADSARFGCGALLVISANGKHCVAKVADCGPNRCVEQAASYSGCASHFPIIDASPLITKYLLGMSGVGWSDKKLVTATLAPKGASLGCPGVVPTPQADGAAPPPKDLGPPPAKDQGAPPAPDTKPPAKDSKSQPPAHDQAAPPGPSPDGGALPPQVQPDAADNSGAGQLTGGCAVSAPGAGPPRPLPATLVLLALVMLVALGRLGSALRQ